MLDLMGLGGGGGLLEFSVDDHLHVTLLKTEEKKI